MIRTRIGTCQQHFSLFSDMLGDTVRTGTHVKYFKNTELANIYGVSEKSVRNWIKVAQEGRLELELHSHAGRTYIANTNKNHEIITNQVTKGKKYKNKRSVRTLTPKPEFYKAYSKSQVLDIISSITVHKEVPLQYGYANGGADSWDKYAARMADEGAPNILRRSIELIDMMTPSLDSLLSDHHKINVVDLGPGNGLPVKPTVERLIAQGKMGRYIAIDISAEMLTIVEKNMREWFGDDLIIETHVRDFSYERFGDIINSGFKEGVSANVVFLLGGTLSNFRSPSQPLQVINNSLGLNDLLIHSGYLDTSRTRRSFDFSAPSQPHLRPSRIIAYLMNIDDSLFDMELMFSEETQSRVRIMRPKVDLSIKFELEDGERTIELRKNSPILLWRHKHHTAADMLQLFDNNEFDLMEVLVSKDQDYAVSVHKIKTDLEPLA